MKRVWKGYYSSIQGATARCGCSMLKTDEKRPPAGESGASRIKGGGKGGPVQKPSFSARTSHASAKESPSRRINGQDGRKRELVKKEGMNINIDRSVGKLARWPCDEYVGRP